MLGNKYLTKDFFIASFPFLLVLIVFFITYQNDLLFVGDLSRNFFNFYCHSEVYQENNRYLVLVIQSIWSLFYNMGFDFFILKKVVIVIYIIIFFSTLFLTYKLIDDRKKRTFFWLFIAYCFQGYYLSFTLHSEQVLMTYFSFPLIACINLKNQSNTTKSIELFLIILMFFSYPAFCLIFALASVNHLFLYFFHKKINKYHSAMFLVYLVLSLVGFGMIINGNHFDSAVGATFSSSLEMHFANTREGLYAFCIMIAFSVLLILPCKGILSWRIKTLFLILFCILYFDSQWNFNSGYQDSGLLFIRKSYSVILFRHIPIYFFFIWDINTSYKKIIDHTFGYYNNIIIMLCLLIHAPFAVSTWSKTKEFFFNEINASHSNKVYIQNLITLGINGWQNDMDFIYFYYIAEGFGKDKKVLSILDKHLDIEKEYSLCITRSCPRLHLNDNACEK